MKHVKSNLDKLSKNVDQVSKLQRKDPDDKFEEVMSVFNEKADNEYNVCKVLKGTGLRIRANFTEIRFWILA